MRFQLFVFSVLCLCYVISALPKLEQNYEHQNRPKRTIILKTMIKKMIWQKFSNFMNLPITRKPPINLSTLRNRIPMPTRQSMKSTSNNVVPPSSPTGPSSLPDPNPSRDNAKNNMASGPVGNSMGMGASGPSGPVGNNNNNQQLPISAGENNNRPNPTSTAVINDPNSAGFEFSNPEGFTDQRNGPRKKQSNNFRPNIEQFGNQNFRQAYAPEEEQNLRLTSGHSGEENYGQTSSDYTHNIPSNQQSNSPSSNGQMSFSAPEGYNDRNNSPNKQQTNNNSPPSGPPAVQTFGPEEQNYGPSNPEDFPATAISDHRNRPQHQQSHQSPENHFIDYSLNQNSPLESSYPNQNLDKQLRQSPISNYDSNGNYNNDNFVQQKNQITQSNSSPTPFLINYPHHQHYQQLIPSNNVNKLSNSIRNIEIPQNNYHHQQQFYNNQEDSSNLNQFHQPTSAFNLYSPEQYYY